MGWTGLKTENSQEIIPEIKEKVDYVISKKDKYSACTKETLEILKKENSGNLPKRVFICGLDTECCVLSTAIGFFERGIEPIILADYCASSGGQKFHDAGILSLGRLIGFSNIIRL